MNKLEVCANSYSSALAAQEGGAIRVELCENMAEGGTTPSYAQIKLCKQRLDLEIWPIIRPRGGDFLYSDDEFELMKIDVQACKELHCNGVVFGILRTDGTVDEERCTTLIKIAHPMPVAFHRAFDLVKDKKSALETIITLGFARILTSGGAESALAGAEEISKLMVQAARRIEIMPGAGINPGNITEIKEQTGATVFHASARIPMGSRMLYQNTQASLGAAENYQYKQTSAEIVKQLVDALKL
jgi:copper homeostasis protein